ncbi:MAG TPA: hypothetical protein VI136_08645 [Verrucomicrobiae bacterium]
MLGHEYHPAAEAEYLAEVEYYSRVSADLGLRFVKGKRCWGDPLF